jgi:Thymidylate synthase complementing protein
MTSTARVIADSVNPDGQRITTLQLRYWRAIHAEFMTHRAFCISGNSRLDFDLPSGQKGKNTRRAYSLPIRDFVTKWHEGAAVGKAPRFSGKTLDALADEACYSSEEVREFLEMSNSSNLNTFCREGKVEGAVKVGRVWYGLGSAWKKWRSSQGVRRFSIRGRLAGMRIRQVDERTGQVITSTVKDCMFSGVKPVFRLTAGGFKVEATADHRVLTGAGWKRLADIVPGKDEVRTYQYGCGSKEDPFRKIDGKWVSAWSKKVRAKVGERQGWTCAETGLPLDPSFHVHHVIPRHERPDLAFCLDNVVAVNPEAHHKLHGVQGWQVGVTLGSRLHAVDSITPIGEIDTYDLEISGEFANFFADGVVVHNSRNASSSRAVPVKTVLAQVWDDPAGPLHWGANQAGMQAHAELTPKRQAAAKFIWKWAGRAMCLAAWASMKLGLHKQVANRLLEPWQFISVVVTATEWENFFALRDHPDAQPEIRDLAQAMRTAMQASTPVALKWGGWHLPYGGGVEESTARCARVSYLTHDRRQPQSFEDRALHDRLVKADPPHLSPAEHPAQAKKGQYANFSGWSSYRHLLGK